jgi:hypothetical protein
MRVPILGFFVSLNISKFQFFGVTIIADSYKVNGMLKIEIYTFRKLPVVMHQLLCKLDARVNVPTFGTGSIWS